MNAQITVDTSRLRLAFRSYKAATQKDTVSILNRAARNVAFMASSFTKKGNPNKILRDLMRDPHLRYALTALALKKRGIGKLPSPEFQKAVDKLIARRMSSANYLRAGWAKAVEDMGGTFLGPKLRGATGYANKAVVSRLIAEVINNTTHDKPASVRGAELIGNEAVKKAVAYVAEDMIKFAQKIMGETARGFAR